MTKPLLLLIDASALIHRGFHALPPLTVSRSGEMTNAVLGFANMLFRVLADQKPTHWAVAFDRPTPTFRHLQYEAYKAQRPPAPPELVSQFGRVRQLCDALGIPGFERDGFEADDIIGALARQAEAQGIDCLIVTGDNDALQLVSPTVRVLTNRGHFGDTVIYDEEAVVGRYGLPPRLLADLKGLEGDPSDNIPGVPGVGRKTGIRLLQEHGSLDGVYAALEAVTPPRLRDILEANRELAFQSRDLATIDTAAPVELDVEACRWRGYDTERVMALLRELEFRSLMGRLPRPPQEAPAALITSSPPAAASSAPVEVADTAAKVEAAIARLRAAVLPSEGLVVHLQTSGPPSFQRKDARLVGLCLRAESGPACYVPLLDFDDGVRRRLAALLGDESLPKTAHDAKPAMLALARHDIEWRGPLFDTMIAAHLLNEKALSLHDLAFARLGAEVGAAAGRGRGRAAPLLAEPTPQDIGAEAEAVLRLRDLFEGELTARGQERLFAAVEMPLVPVLAQMERSGVALDLAVLRQMSQELEAQVRDLERAIYDDVGHAFNINSTQQLAAVLFEELRLPSAGGRSFRRKDGGYSTAAGVLEGLRGAHPIIERLLDYRQLTKLKSTYVDALPTLADSETGRVHTTLNQTGTVTGRLASSEPNLQNIPIRTALGRRIRDAFVARGDDPSDGRTTEGWRLLSADYSQIDIRVLAHLSQDSRLLAAFAADEDIHTITAADVFNVAQSEVTPEMRRIAKVVNFGIVYGMSEHGLAQGTDLSREAAAQFIRDYFDRYHGVRDYLERTKRAAFEQGYVATLLGRRRYLPEIASPNRVVREAAERMAINMPVQGTTADIIKVAMVRLDEALASRRQDGWRSRMILQVHDELLFEAPVEELAVLTALAVDIMSHAIALSVPLKVDIKVGRSWGEME